MGKGDEIDQTESLIISEFLFILFGLLTFQQLNVGGSGEGAGT